MVSSHKREQLVFLSLFCFIFSLDSWSVFQDFPVLTVDHYMADRLLKMFHLQTVVPSNEHTQPWT